ncbi:M28 family peptidase [Brevundimonas sp. BAL450]|uniref:Aminopeptidase Y n=1 Tax=Brevundimonas abyssalis TAR-001 TaxID=1391729 RepID=A0A8E0NAA0_9CAUL|nr:MULTISPECIES: M28 family peptidase [Brevundimonas]MBG7614357.1 M28 family peptidase [Brevundimonas sp. BAL450]GAD58081.1 aminopeptidase Y [Brevundimonas abyssalis TAR-001]
MLRTLTAACALLAFATPALGQDEAALREAVAAYDQPSNAERLAVLTGQLDAAGLAYEIQTFEGGGRAGAMTGSNVIVTLGEGERDLLLTAHYDAVVLQSGELADGLVDNAASTVALIEAARVLSGRDLNHRVQVIFFDQEELGLIGAQRWIAANGTDRVAAVVNSDVAAFGDTLMYGENNGERSGFVLTALREECAERAMTCVGFPVYPPSDDRAFIAAEVPVVSIGFQNRVGAHQMWLAFNGGRSNGLAEGFVPEVFQLIHSEGDVIEAVDPATVALAAEVYVDLITRLDAAAQ